MGFLFSAESEVRGAAMHPIQACLQHSLQVPSRAQEPPLNTRQSFLFCKGLWAHPHHTQPQHLCGEWVCHSLVPRIERAKYSILGVKSRATKALAPLLVFSLKTGKGQALSLIRVERVLPFLTGFQSPLEATSDKAV